MSSTQRVIVSILAGVITFCIMGAIGMKPNATFITISIVVTAMITKNFRNDKDEINR